MWQISHSKEKTRWSEKKFTSEEARRIGDQIGVDWGNTDLEEFRKGLTVELEHGVRNSQTNVTDDDESATGKIALAHLTEISDYYTRLLAMEQDGKSSGKNGK